MAVAREKLERERPQPDDDNNQMQQVFRAINLTTTTIIYQLAQPRKTLGFTAGQQRFWDGRLDPAAQKLFLPPANFEVNPCTTPRTFAYPVLLAIISIFRSSLRRGLIWNSKVIKRKL